MITLASALRIPSHVSFTLVDGDAVLLNTRTNKYFSLEEVGARLWALLQAGHTLQQAHQAMLDEYDVDAAELERDVLELVESLLQNGLVELVQT